jgi:hypothetical protein
LDQSHLFGNEVVVWLKVHGAVRPSQAQPPSMANGSMSIGRRLLFLAKGSACLFPNAFDDSNAIGGLLREVVSGNHDTT